MNFNAATHLMVAIKQNSSNARAMLEQCKRMKLPVIMRHTGVKPGNVAPYGGSYDQHMLW